MAPIYTTAFVTSVLALAAVGTLIHQLAPIRRRKELLVLSLAGEAMSPLAYYGIRLPAKKAL